MGAALVFPGVRVCWSNRGANVGIKKRVAISASGNFAKMVDGRGMGRGDKAGRILAQA
jgi:hypothetical protein